MKNKLKLISALLLSEFIMISCSRSTRFTQDEIVYYSSKIQEYDNTIKSTNVSNTNQCIIKTEKCAINIAESILLDNYGNSILKQRPFKIVLINNYWIIEGSFHSIPFIPRFGGVAEIIIDKRDGRVITMIHGK
jgi:hypothetical protein